MLEADVCLFSNDEGIAAVVIALAAAASAAFTSFFSCFFSCWSSSLRSVTRCRDADRDLICCADLRATCMKTITLYRYSYQTHRGAMHALTGYHLCMDSQPYTQLPKVCNTKWLPPERHAHSVLQALNLFQMFTCVYVVLVQQVLYFISHCLLLNSCCV
eukprot:scpid92550/ scgid4886/ 